MTVNRSEPYPLVTNNQELLVLNESRYEKNNFYRIETPFLPDYEAVRKAGDEGHIPYRPWTIGYIPQTFEDERYICDPAPDVGNSLPLKAILLDSQLHPGEVSNVKNSFFFFFPFFIHKYKSNFFHFALFTSSFQIEYAD